MPDRPRKKTKCNKKRDEGIMKKEQILEMARQLDPKLREIWQDLHRHPELGFEEVYTARKVAEVLRGLEMEVHDQVGGTGVVGIIRGAHPGKTLLLRADMDALPIQEETGLACASCTPGKMHACGHDAHVTWLLGAAMLLSRMRQELHGTVKLLFQPSEEAPGGAQRMLACGVLKDPDVDMALAAHVSPDYPSGKYLLQTGPVTANPDFFTLTLCGKGAHGSQPEKAVDAINMGVKVYELLETFVSRCISPCTQAVLSVCTFHAGTSRGAIPGSCELTGTVRSFQPQVQQAAKAFIDQCAKAVTQIYGGSYTLDYRIACFPVENDPDLICSVQAHTEELLGPDAVLTQADRFMGGEDFCFISREVPSVFAFVGCKNEELFQAAPLHNPAFRLDEGILAPTAAMLAYNAVCLLQNGAR